MGSFKPGDPAAVEALFDQIAPRYDLLNDRRKLVARAGPQFT